MEISRQQRRDGGGEYKPPARASEAREIESAIGSIEAAVIRGGGQPDVRITGTVRDFAERVLSNYQGAEFNKLLSASILAAELHAPQGWRLDGIPFVVHPFEVAMTLSGALGIRDPDLLCAALLHDTVEDQPRRLAALSGGKQRDWPNRTGEKAEALNVIQDLFGGKVAALVDRLTNGDFAAMAAASPEAQLDKFPEHRFYRAHVRELYESEKQIDREGFAVKAADFLENLWGLDRLRTLGILNMVEKQEDKRRSLAQGIADTIETIPSVHPLYAVRLRVAAFLSDAVSRMAPVSA